MIRKKTKIKLLEEDIVKTIISLLSLLLLPCVTPAQGKQNCQKPFRIVVIQPTPSNWLHSKIPELEQSPNYFPPVNHANESAWRLRNGLEEAINKRLPNWKVPGCWVIFIQPSQNFREVVVRLFKEEDYLRKGARAKDRKTPNRLRIKNPLFEDYGELLAEEILKETGKKSRQSNLPVHRPRSKTAGGDFFYPPSLLGA